MMFTSGEDPVVGTLVSPLLRIAKSVLVLLDVYKTDDTDLEIYRSTVLGQVSQRVFRTSGLVQDKWQTIQVCLPVGVYSLVFITQPSSGNSMAIDNVKETNIWCVADDQLTSKL